MLHKLEYNTARTPLSIPEYGRHIQKLVEQACSLPHKAQRNKAARYIIKVMGNLNPHMRDFPDFQHKLWDQLFIMSNYELDADSPFEKPQPIQNLEKPQPLPYPQQVLKYKFYGSHMLQMIAVCNSWPEGKKKEMLKIAIASHMKKCFLNWNKDTVEDSLILEHLYELSHGQINLLSQTTALASNEDFKRAKNQAGQRKYPTTERFTPKNNSTE